MESGRGFVAWVAGTKILVRSTREDAPVARTLTKSWSVIARLAAAGDRVVFAERLSDARRPRGGPAASLVRITTTAN